MDIEAQHQQLISGCDSPIIDGSKKKGNWKKKIIGLVLFLAITCTAVPICIKISEDVQERNVTSPKRTGYMKFQDFNSVFKIPFTCDSFTLYVNLTTNESTLVNVYGEVNDGRESYDGKSICNGSCFIRMKVEEALVTGESVTVVVGPKERISSLKGILHFSPIQNSERIKLFSGFKNTIMSPVTSTNFTIDVQLNVKSFTRIHLSVTLNGQRPFVSIQSCNRSCHMHIRIYKKLVSRDNVTLILAPKNKINSLEGVIHF